MAPPTSIRIRPQALAVIDAWAAFLADRRGTARSRADAVEAIILAAHPPDALSPETAAIRRAHKALKEQP